MPDHINNCGLKLARGLHPPFHLEDLFHSCFLFHFAIMYENKPDFEIRDRGAQPYSMATSGIKKDSRADNEVSRGPTKSVRDDLPGIAETAAIVLRRSPEPRASFRWDGPLIPPAWQVSMLAVFAPTLYFLCLVRVPLFRLLQAVPLFIFMSLVMCVLAVVQRLLLASELLIDALFAALSFLPDYVSYAAPRMQAMLFNTTFSQPVEAPTSAAPFLPWRAVSVPFLFCFWRG